MEEKEKSISSKDHDLQSLSDKYVGLKTNFEKMSIECDTLKQGNEDVLIELKKYKKDNKELNEKLKEAEEKIEAEKEKKKVKNVQEAKLEVERDHKILDKDVEEEKDGKFNKIKHMEENVKAKDDVEVYTDKTTHF